MSPFRLRHPRVRTQFVITVCIVFLTLALMWTVRPHAANPKGAPAKPSHGAKADDLRGVTPAATTFVVNNVGDQDDSNIGDGHCDTDGNLGNGDQCTLRAAVSEGKVGNTGHSINFNLPSGSVIVLSTQLPSFSGNVSIVGPGSSQLTIQRNTVGGTPSFSIFFFAPINGNFTDAVSGLTIANGSNGCLVNQSFDTVTLTDIVVKNCTGTNGGGILNGGIMTITNSTVTGNVASGNGGGIYNAGSSNNSGLNLTDTTVSGNSATGSGGGIHNESGPANFNRITVNSNTANTQGGGIANSNSGANLTVTNSTVSGDTANAVNGNGGGIANIGVGSTLTLANVTVTANASSASGGGGVSNVANTVTIGNSIVAKNTGGFADLKGTFVSGGYNLIGLSGGDGLNNGVNGDRVGSPGAAIDPLLGALADNGGATKTHALLVGSPAIDAGNSSQITDQRNLTRPVDDPTVANAAGGNASDIGSYEFNPYQVNTLVDADDGACTSLATGNGCTLREAIIAANASPREITFASTLTAGGPAVIDLLTALPAINANVQVQGPGANLLTIERSSAGGTPDFRIFLINTGKSLTVSGVTIAKGKPSSAATFPFNSGGNFLNDHGTLTINNCVVSNALSGGGILNFSGVLAINSSTISGNAGNGLLNTMPQSAANSPASATINNSTVSGNLGSGIRNNTDIGPASSPMTVLVTNSTISGNTLSAGGAGAAITNASQVGGTATINLINTTISGNTITGSGGVGGIYNIGIFGGGPTSVAKVILTNSTVFGNSTLSGPDNAGGLNDIINSCVGCVVTTQLRNSIVAGNTVSGSPSDIVGTVDSNSSFNLIGTGGSGGLVNGTNGNQVGVASPGLGSLASNGGPTQTHALLSTSPALDAGDNCVTQAAHCSDSNISQLTTDQRGFSRIVDGPDGDTTATVDIGAYETQTALANLPSSMSINEDTQLVVAFDAGDASTITSVTATSDNAAVVPNDAAHLLAANNGSQGSVTINPAANASGAPNVTITINRTGGVSDVKTFALTVNPVNDAPTFTKGPDQTINEDAGAQTITNWATNISTGPADESGQTLSFFVNTNNSGLFFAAPSVDAAGTLTYRANADANGTATVTILVKDNGGTTNGGVDTTSVSFVITVNSVNDAPVFTKGPDKTVLEDSGSFFGGWATNVAPGPTQESAQTVTFVVANNTNPALFSAAPAVSSNGALSFTPAANANGSATITLVLKDNGGTANGGVDTSAPQSFTINVTPVNDQPSFTKGPDQTVNEDAGAQTVNNWATNISAGAPDEASQTLTFVLSNNNGPLFSVPPAVSANGTLTYTPAADANGTATVTVTLKDSGDTANGGSNVSGSTNFLITVRSVNDAPTFSKGADQTVNEDAGAQTVAGWASAISPGPANESAQTVTFTATNDNNALFSVQPAISSTGTLTYTPAANASGVANLSVTLKDSGGATNGGVDTSASQTFKITVNAENDPPSFTKGADQTVNNNAGAQSVANWATNILAGPSDESSQTLSFQVTGNTNPGLFSTAPAVSSTGTLNYTPSTSAGGTATITINLRDSGGTTNGGVDTSASQSFTITVTPVGGFVSFESSSSNTTENSGSTTVNVVRTGNTSLAAAVNYATNADAGVPCSTANGVASPKCDFTAALGTLNFAAAETSKPITILISQDSFVEGPENITLTLSSPTGGSALGTPSTMSVTIADDATEPPTNIIDDANMFVRMHYHDFLNREADQSGLDFWTGQMTNCGNSDLTVCRVNVSGAFFLSIEFQQTGYLVERVYKTA